MLATKGTSANTHSILETEKTFEIIYFILFISKPKPR